MTRDQAAALAAGNPLSFLHVVRSDIDLPPGTDPHAPAVYAKAKENLTLLMREGSFVQEPAPTVYVYELATGRRSQVGVVGCVHVDDYESNLIRKHENTRKDKEDDRTRHILTLNAQAEPVFLAYDRSPFIAQLNQRVMATVPLYEFTQEEVTHRVWRAAEPSHYVDGFRRIANAYVADGHHRSAGAWRAAMERRLTAPDPTGAAEYNWFLAVLFPSTQLRIRAYHRVVKDLNGLTPEAFLGQLGQLGTLTPTEKAAPEHPGSFGVCVAGRWYRLTFDAASLEALDAVRALDASILHARVLAPVLGIGDVRSDPRLGFVGGIDGIAELERQVTSGAMAVGFALYPVSMQQLMAIADHGATMPPKSTWFEPKLRSGLFLHALE